MNLVCEAENLQTILQGLGGLVDVLAMAARFNKGLLLFG